MKKDDISLGVLPVEEEKEVAEDDEKLAHIRHMIELMQATWNEQIEIFLIQAKMNKEYYDALVTAGFSKEQAIDLVKGKGT